MASQKSVCIMPETFDEWKGLSSENKEYAEYLLLYNVERKLGSVKIINTTSSFFGGILGGIIAIFTYFKFLG